MKRKIFEILFITIGVLLLSYPIVANFIEAYHKTVAISNYQDEVSSVNDETKKKALEEAKLYNQNFDNQTSIDISLKDSDVEVNSSNYYSLLDIGEVMAYINIPKINVYLPIYHSINEDVLQKGIGHMENTALPVGGLGTHAVLAGHTGLAQTKMFDDIDKLELGDKFYIHVLDEILEYQVDDIKVVEPDDTSAIKIEKDKDYVTLVTCTPYMINTHRLLVRGTRIDYDNLEYANVNKNEENNTSQEKTLTNQIIQTRKVEIVISIIVFIIIFVILILIILIDKNNKKIKNKNISKDKNSQNNINSQNSIEKYLEKYKDDFKDNYEEYSKEKELKIKKEKKRNKPRIK